MESSMRLGQHLVGSSPSGRQAFDLATSHYPSCMLDPHCVIVQKLYTGNRVPDSGSEARPVPAISINVAARDARQPEILARVLERPLSPAFEDGASKARKAKKYTTRFCFLGRGEWANTSPKQINEYAAGSQRSLAVEFAWKLYGTPRKTSASVPLMRAALTEKVAEELYAFLARLKADGFPLLLYGREVQYDHLVIVDLARPTDATVQPKIGILPEYRHLYSFGERVA